ncbi:MAG TPA: hypothetical protein VNG12_12905 [Acidimicrobiales bacterium]|nr:hypothetical protein [Acidimicrobiales bacterium]
MALDDLALEQQEWLAICENRAPLTWDLWGAGIARSVVLSPLGRQVSLHLFDKTRAFLGEEWIEKSRPHGTPFLEMLGYSPFNDLPYIHIQRGTALAYIAMLADAPGIEAVQERLRHDPRQWNAALLELETAALAMRHGWVPTCSVRSSRRRSVDVVVRHGVASFAIESTEMHLTLHHRRMSQYFDWMSEVEMALQLRHGLKLVGKIGQEHGFRCPSEAQFLAWRQALAEPVAAILSDGRRRPIIGPQGEAMYLERRTASDEPQPLLERAAIRNDLSSRLIRTLERKASQTHGLPRAWIRLNDVGGLWYFTPWSQLPLSGQLETMATLVRSSLAPHAHVQGVIISDVKVIGGSEEIVNGQQGLVALRRPLSHEPSTRRTLLITRSDPDETALSEMRALYEWYETEPTWLTWACQHMGLAPPAQWFAEEG